MVSVFSMVQNHRLEIKWLYLEYTFLECLALNSKEGIFIKANQYIDAHGGKNESHKTLQVHEPHWKLHINSPGQ